MKKVDWSKVEEAKSDFAKPTAGGYVCKMISATDEEAKERIIVSYDIAEGEFADYYTIRQNSKGYSLPKFNRYYTEKSLPFFKRFLMAVSKSNKGFKFLDNEHNLEGKLIGIVLREREYIYNGEVRVTLDADEFITVEEARAGDYEVKARIILADNQPKTPTVTEHKDFVEVVEDDDLPF